MGVEDALSQDIYIGRIIWVTLYALCEFNSNLKCDESGKHTGKVKSRFVKYLLVHCSEENLQIAIHLLVMHIILLAGSITLLPPTHVFHL